MSGSRIESMILRRLKGNRRMERTLGGVRRSRMIGSLARSDLRYIVMCGFRYRLDLCYSYWMSIARANIGCGRWFCDGVIEGLD